MKINILNSIQLNEVHKEDNLYLIGPFWIIGKSIEDINNGEFSLICEKFLLNWEGNYANRVPKSQFTHKGIWLNKYAQIYGKEYDYYPRGRISFDSKSKQFGINIPKGLNESIILPRILKEYDIVIDDIHVKYTDPTSGNHYTFSLQ